MEVWGTVKFTDHYLRVVYKVNIFYAMKKEAFCRII